MIQNVEVKGERGIIVIPKNRLPRFLESEEYKEIKVREAKYTQIPWHLRFLFIIFSPSSV